MTCDMTWLDHWRLKLFLRAIYSPWPRPLSSQHWWGLIPPPSFIPAPSHFWYMPAGICVVLCPILYIHIYICVCVSVCCIFQYMSNAICIYLCIRIYIYMCVSVLHKSMLLLTYSAWLYTYLPGLFCKRALQKRRYSLRVSWWIRMGWLWLVRSIKS